METTTVPLVPLCSTQARRQDVAAGGAKKQKGEHIFKIQYWMYAATGGPNVKWGGTDFKWEGRAPLAPCWRRPWPHLPLSLHERGDQRFWC